MKNKRIKLISMSDPHPVPAGTKGTIKHVDDIGQIHVDWDNGRTLAVVPEIDKFEITDGKTVLSYFNSNYGYIGHEMTDSSVDKFITDRGMGLQSIEYIANMLQDYILANGLQTDIQE